MWSRAIKFAKTVLHSVIRSSCSMFTEGRQASWYTYCCRFADVDLCTEEERPQGHQKSLEVHAEINDLGKAVDVREKEHNSCFWRKSEEDVEERDAPLRRVQIIYHTSSLQLTAIQSSHLIQPSRASWLSAAKASSVSSTTGVFCRTRVPSTLRQRRKPALCK